MISYKITFPKNNPYNLSYGYFDILTKAGDAYFCYKFKGSRKAYLTHAHRQDVLSNKFTFYCGKLQKTIEFSLDPQNLVK